MKTVDKMNDSDVKEVPTVQGEVTNEAEVLAATVVPPSEVIVSSSEKFTESASEGVSKGGIPASERFTEPALSSENRNGVAPESVNEVVSESVNEVAPERVIAVAPSEGVNSTASEKLNEVAPPEKANATTHSPEESNESASALNSEK